MYFIITLYKSSAVAEMGDRGHNRHGPERGGGCCAPFVGAGTPSNTMSPGPRPRPTSVPSCILTVPPPLLEGGGAGLKSNTMWPRPRPTCLPSFILIRPTVWPQYTNVTDREDRQRSDRIGRTVLQTVAQKLPKISDLRPWLATQ